MTAPGQAKVFQQNAPEGYYKYYPEIFEKPNNPCIIFDIIKVRESLKSQQRHEKGIPAVDNAARSTQANTAAKH